VRYRGSSLELEVRISRRVGLEGKLNEGSAGSGA
jgi:hypothetical protein